MSVSIKMTFMVTPWAGTAGDGGRAAGIEAGHRGGHGSVTFDAGRRRTDLPSPSMRSCWHRVTALWLRAPRRDPVTQVSVRHAGDDAAERNAHLHARKSHSLPVCLCVLQARS